MHGSRERAVKVEPPVFAPGLANPLLIAVHTLIPFAVGLCAGAAETWNLGPGQLLVTVLTLIALPLALLLVAIDVRLLASDVSGIVAELALMIHSALVGGLIFSFMAVCYAAGAVLPVAIAGDSVRLFEGDINGWELMLFLAVFAPLAAFPIGAAMGCLGWVSRWLHPQRL